MASTTIFRLRFNRNYTTFVKTGRGHVKVDFMPIVLFGRTENSQFATTDKEVIEALKKHEHFGSLFFIEEEGKEDAPGKNIPGSQPALSSKAKIPPTPELTPEAGGAGSEVTKPELKADQGEEGIADDANDGEPLDKESTGPEGGELAQEPESGSENAASKIVDPLTHETTVTSKNKAIAFLKEKFGAEFEQTADIAKMKEEAREKYSLVFDNWK